MNNRISGERSGVSRPVFGVDDTRVAADLEVKNPATYVGRLATGVAGGFFWDAGGTGMEGRLSGPPVVAPSGNQTTRPGPATMQAIVSQAFANKFEARVDFSPPRPSIEVREHPNTIGTPGTGWSFGLDFSDPELDSAA